VEKNEKEMNYFLVKNGKSLEELLERK